MICHGIYWFIISQAKIWCADLGILSEDAILRSGSDFAGSSQALTLSNLAHGSQNQQQDSASFGTQSLAQPQVFSTFFVPIPNFPISHC